MSLTQGASHDGPRAHSRALGLGSVREQIAQDPVCEPSQCGHLTDNPTKTSVMRAPFRPAFETGPLLREARPPVSSQLDQQPLSRLPAPSGGAHQKCSESPAACPDRTWSWCRQPPPGIGAWDACACSHVANTFALPNVNRFD